MPIKFPKTVRPDAKGRITLGRIAEGVSSYIVTQDKHNRLVLEPLVEIPASEKWLFNNKSALKSIEKGIADAATGRVKHLGSFVNYIDEDDKE